MALGLFYYGFVYTLSIDNKAGIRPENWHDERLVVMSGCFAAAGQPFVHKNLTRGRTYE